MAISSPRTRQSRPFQRGASECRAWNKRLYLAQIIWLRLRRAEGFGEKTPITIASSPKTAQTIAGLSFVLPGP